jgi:hypothetical protein
MAMLIRALTYRQTWEHGFSHFSASGKLLQQSFGFFAEETIRTCHERGKVPTLLEASLTLCRLLWSGLTWHQHP